MFFSGLSNACIILSNFGAISSSRRVFFSPPHTAPLLLFPHPLYQKSEAGKKSKTAKNVLGWNAACSQARKQLGLQGFVVCKKGTQFYNVTKKIYDDSKASL